VDENLRNVTNDIVANITAIEGVNLASALLKTYARVMYLQASETQEAVLVNISLAVYAIDPMSCVQSAFLLPYFVLSGDPYQTVPLLAENQFNVISTFMPVIQYASGQPVYDDSVLVVIQTSEQNYSQSCSVVDVMSTEHAARTESYFPGEPEVRDFLIMNISYIQNILNTTNVNKVYVDLADDANHTRVMEEIQSLANFTTEEIVSSQANIDQVLDSRTGQSIYGVYTLNLLFSLIYLTAGLMIISVVKTRRLQKQFSILRALGTSNSSIMSSVLVDVGMSMLIGILIGSIVGLFLSLLMLQIPLAFLGVTTEIIWSRLPIFIVFPVSLLIGIILLSFMSAFFTTYLATRKGLSSNLADDFRHIE
jgi:ABC-type antimicrobial peptide transport system permease subunit